MTDYALCWCPENEEIAEFIIDPANEGRRFWQWGLEMARELGAYLPEPCEVVVDYGCGVGRVLRHMPGTRRIGVDVSREMLTIARTHDLTAELVLTGGRSIPLEDGIADFVYSVLTLQHMDAMDVALVLRDVKRVLRPGGRCLLQFSAFGRNWGPNARMRRRPGVNWKGQRAGSGCTAHQTLKYTPDLVAQLARDAEIAVIEIRQREPMAEHKYLDLWGQA